MTIEPDTKDWTWVLRRRCEDCGFDAQALALEELPEQLRAHTGAIAARLVRPGADDRPRPDVWSPLEYACHVRDVHLLFDERVVLMLEQDDPAFGNWDQDATAVEQAYSEQEPAQVAREMVDAADAVARRYAGVTGDQWQRSGRRSDGSRFTVETLGRYHLHDLVHHVHDVGS